MKIALISDIHSNFDALESLMVEFNKEEIKEVLVAGDLIGYYYRPDKVIKTIMLDKRFHCIKGNHERMFEEALKDNKKLEQYRKKYGSSFDVCMDLLSQKQINWLLSLPKTLNLSFGKNSFHISHGSLSGDEEYIYPNTNIQELKANYSESKFTIFGNTHYPFIHHNKAKYLINPGSVGQPRDIGNMSSYVIIDLKTEVIQFKRKKFNISKIIKEVMKHDPNIPFLQNILRR